MKCKLAFRLDKTKSVEIPGTIGIAKSLDQELWGIAVTESHSFGTKKIWCDACAPCQELGPGTMFYAGTMAIGEGRILWLIAPNNRYYNLDNYKRVGEPPMVTIFNSPANWTLVDGVLSDGDRHSSIQIPHRP